LIEQMKFTIKKLRHKQFGQSSERHAVLEQLELSLAEMEEDASQAEAAARIAANAATEADISRSQLLSGASARATVAGTSAVLRIVYPSPSACP